MIYHFGLSCIDFKYPKQVTIAHCTYDTETGYALISGDMLGGQFKSGSSATMKRVIKILSNTMGVSQSDIQIQNLVSENGVRHKGVLFPMQDNVMQSALYYKRIDSRREVLALNSANTHKLRAVRNSIQRRKKHTAKTQTQAATTTNTSTTNTSRFWNTQLTVRYVNDGLPGLVWEYKPVSR